MAERDLILRMRADNAAGFRRDVESDATAVQKVGDAARKSANAVQRAGDRLTKMSKATQRAGRTMTRNVTRPVALAGAATAKLAIDFDKGMRNVNSIANLPERRLAALSKQVLDLGRTSAQSPKVLASALYDIVSSGFQNNPAGAMRVLGASAKAAVAGLTDANTAAMTITAGLNAYNLPASQATNVSNILFRTVDRGVVTFEQLANYIGLVYPYSYQLGVGLNEVGAAMSTLTKQGIPAEYAVNRLQNVMIHLSRQKGKLGEAFHTLGYGSAEAAIKSLGLQGTLEALIGTTDGSQKAISRLFPDMQAFSGVMALTGKHSKDAHSDLKAFQSTTGATQKAFNQQTKSMSFRWDQMINRLKADAISWGQTFLPVIENIVNHITKMLEKFEGLNKHQKNLVAYGAAAAAALGPLLYVLGAIGRGLGPLIKLGGKGGAALARRLPGRLSKAGAAAASRLSERGSPTNPMYVVVVNDVPGGGKRPKGGPGGAAGRAGKWGGRLATLGRGATSLALGPAGLAAAWATALAVPAYLGYKYATRPKPAVAERTRANVARQNRQLTPGAPQTYVDDWGLPHRLPQQPAWMRANTAAQRGYKGIPAPVNPAAQKAADGAKKSADKSAAASQATEAAVKALPAMIAAMPPPIIQLDGEAIGRAVKRASDKSKAKK